MGRLDTCALLPFIVVLWANSALAEEPAAKHLEAVQMAYKSALDARGEEQLVLYRDVRDKLDGIIDDYPTSDVAVDILFRREFLGLDLQTMDTALYAALGDNPPKFVAPRGGSQTASSSGDAQTTGQTPAALPQITNGTVAAMPPAPENDRQVGSQFAPATEDSERRLGLSRQDIRELQARLTSLGIDPNGIDGVVGRGTRGAITTWQEGSGMPATGYLDAPQLERLRAASQSVYDTWLTNPQNRARIEVVAITPARMAGTWRFTARCGSGSRMPGKTFTGTMTLEHAGGRSYRGRMRTSQGLTGSVTVQVSGRNFSTQENWGLFGGRVQTQGRISDDARVVNGRDSNGCRVTASKA